jgi:hypothetical protein
MHVNDFVPFRIDDSLFNIAKQLKPDDLSLTLAEHFVKTGEYEFKWTKFKLDLSMFNKYSSSNQYLGLNSRSFKF